MMQIPGYKILETLGKGGMATVYLAIQESFERKVAVKVMSPQLAQDPAFGDRFQREAKIVSQLNHPNIVTVYDVGVVDNHHYLAMQYVDGKELRFRMKDLGLAEKIRVVKEVASALNYAGNKGYVHRDVKPENVMLSEEDGRAILMDFGIAKTSDSNHSMTKTGMAIGTPYYMSPEQAQGKPVDKRSDIYSLGVMFFQMLTGRVPYDAESQVAIGIKHITEPVPQLPTHLKVFQPIIDKVMAKDPAQRYQTGAELIKDLEKVSLSDMDDVDRIIKEETASISKTDPHAKTVLGEATPPPPTLNTGNVTTADAARLAKRIAAEPKIVVKQESSHSPMVAVVVVILVVAAAGWFFTRTTHEPEVTQPAIEITEAPAPQAEPAEPVTAMEGLASINAEKARAEQEEAIRAVEEKRKQEEMAAAAAEEKRKQEEMAAAAAEEKRKQEEMAAAAAEAKRKQEEAAAMAAEQKRKQEEAAAARIAEQKRQAELARAAEEKKQQEAVRAAEQKKQQEVAALLARAESLREQGKLVSPANDNAVLAYRELLRIDPDNVKAANAIREVEKSYLMGIRYQIDEGKLDEAASKLREANAVFPNNAMISELLALHQKKVEEAAAAKAEAMKPKITKIIVNEAAFESMQLVQKSSLPMARTAYIGMSYRNFEGATSLLQAVLYDGSRSIKITQKPVVVTGAEGTVFFTLARPVEGFEDGGYHLDLLLGEQKLSSISFTVKH